MTQPISRNETLKIKTTDVRFVKAFFPRTAGEVPGLVERYRAAIGFLPPIVVARDGILVDGYHRWQAHIREGLTEIDAINLGNLADIEIKKEAFIRNNKHGHQLSAQDKKLQAAQWYSELSGSSAERYAEISRLLSITVGTAQKYCAEARQTEVEQQKAKAWDLWLDCHTQQKIADVIGVGRDTINTWVSEFGTDSKFRHPPKSLQLFDIWEFAQAPDDDTDFDALPPQVVENLLWYSTQPGQTVFAPFAGAGVTIRVAKEMGRRVWSCDRKPSTPMLPIHQHKILDGWPVDAPKRPDFILLDIQRVAKMPLDAFYGDWEKMIKICAEHIAPNGKIAYLIRPTQDEDGMVVEHALAMLPACWKVNMVVERYITVADPTSRYSPQQIEWAQKNRILLNRRRDLVILRARDKE